MDIADVLIQYKEENNLSIYKLAKLTNLNDKTIRNILRRKTAPSIKTCYKLSKLIGKNSLYAGTENDFSQKHLTN